VQHVAAAAGFAKVCGILMGAAPGCLDDTNSAGLTAAQLANNSQVVRVLGGASSSRVAEEAAANGGEEV
jgi:hypothetical protein